MILLFVVQGARIVAGQARHRRGRRVRRAAPDRPPRDASRRRPRPADHRAVAPALRRRHGARRRARLRALFSRLSHRRAGRARALAPAARGRGQLPPGRARPHGAARRRAAHPAQPARRGPRAFSLSTCLISVPIFVFTALLFVLFPRVGLSLAPAQPPARGAHGRLLRSRRTRRGRRAPLGSRRSRCASSSPTDRSAAAAHHAAAPRHRLRRLRRTGLGPHAERSPPRRALRRRHALPPEPRTRRPATRRSRSTSSPSIRPWSSCPAHAVAVQLKSPTQTLMADPLVAPARPRGRAPLRRRRRARRALRRLRRARHRDHLRGR